MKKFYTKRFSLICAFAASALLLGGGCSEDETEPAIGSKGVSSEVFVSSDAGSRTIKVETSGPWQARLTPETRLWVSVDGADSGETGGSLNLNYRTNNSLPRKGTILVSSARQQVVDTIYLMQYGTTPLLEFKYIGKQYSSVSTIDSVAIDTNIPPDPKKSTGRSFTTRIPVPNRGPTASATPRISNISGSGSPTTRNSSLARRGSGSDFRTTGAKITQPISQPIRVSRAVRRRPAR